MSQREFSAKPRFYQQKSYYGGIATGFALALLIPVIALFIIGHMHAKPIKGKPAVTTGNPSINGTALIQLDDALMTSGMAAGLNKASAQFPGPLQNIPFTNVGVTSKAGHNMEVTADVEVVGLPLNVVTITLGPRINDSGHLDFQVLNIYGLDLGPVNQIIEDQIDAQFVNVGQGQLMKGFTYKLTDVHTVDGGLVITSKIAGSL